jgi:hypothetical protein
MAERVAEAQRWLLGVIERGLERTGLSMHAASPRAGLDPWAISRIIRSGSLPTYATMAALAHLFHESIPYSEDDWQRFGWWRRHSGASGGRWRGLAVTATSVKEMSLEEAITALQDFCCWLKERMEASGHCPYSVSKETGVSPSTIGNLVRREAHYPYTSTVVALTTFFPAPADMVLRWVNAATVWRDHVQQNGSIAGAGKRWPQVPTQPPSRQKRTKETEGWIVEIGGPQEVQAILTDFVTVVREAIARSGHCKITFFRQAGLSANTSSMLDGRRMPAPRTVELLAAHLDVVPEHKERWLRAAQGWRYLTTGRKRLGALRVSPKLWRQPPLCACGCGSLTTSPSARYIKGHYKPTRRQGLTSAALPSHHRPPKSIREGWASPFCQRLWEHWQRKQGFAGDLSLAAGYGRGFVHDIFQRNSPPTNKGVRELCRALCLSPDEQAELIGLARRSRTSPGWEAIRERWAGVVERAKRPDRRVASALRWATTRRGRPLTAEELDQLAERWEKKFEGEGVPITKPMILGCWNKERRGRPPLHKRARFVEELRADTPKPSWRTVTRAVESHEGLLQDSLDPEYLRRWFSRYKKREQRAKAVSR